MDQVRAAYVPPHIQSMALEWDREDPIGQTSHVKELDEIFAWMPGSLSGWYGWPNDGKGEFFNFMSIIKCMFDKNEKFLMMKQEDMSSTKVEGKIQITANSIYKNIAWTYSGKTPNRLFAKKYFKKQIEFDEYMSVLEWVQERFFVIYPEDRQFKSVKDTIRYYIEKFGITGWLIDPWKSIIQPSGDRGDLILNECLIELNDLTKMTGTHGHVIAHPKSMTDQRVSKKADSAYKVVNQYMISGGAPFDNNMDQQYSIFRPERHLDPRDPKVHFINLKQRKAEEALVEKGTYESILFERHSKRYYFNGVCPLDGSIHPKFQTHDKNIIDFTEAGKKKADTKTDDLPF